MLIDEPFAALDADLRLDPDLAAIPRFADRLKPPAARRIAAGRRSRRPALQRSIITVSISGPVE